MTHPGPSVFPRPTTILLAFVLLGSALAAPACGESHGMPDAGAPGADAAATDAPLTATDAVAVGQDAASPPEDGGPTCSCRTGSYRATGMGAGFTVDYPFTVEECDGVLVCTVRGEVRRCMPTPDGVFRVYLDTAGYVQLIFSETPCEAPWTGVYATEGGSAPITATREP